MRVFPRGSQIGVSSINTFHPYEQSNIKVFYFLRTGLINGVLRFYYITRPQSLPWTRFRFIQYVNRKFRNDTRLQANFEQFKRSYKLCVNELYKVNVFTNIKLTSRTFTLTRKHSLRIHSPPFVTRVLFKRSLKFYCTLQFRHRSVLRTYIYTFHVTESSVVFLFIVVFLSFIVCRFVH